MGFRKPAPQRNQQIFAKNDCLTCVYRHCNGECRQCQNKICIRAASLVSEGEYVCHCATFITDVTKCSYYKKGEKDNA